MVEVLLGITWSHEVPTEINSSNIDIEAKVSTFYNEMPVFLIANYSARSLMKTVAQMKNNWIF